MEALNLLKRDCTWLQTQIVNGDTMQPSLYEILSSVLQEIIAIAEEGTAFRQKMTMHHELDALLDELNAALEALHEIIEDVINTSQKIALKRLFETLDAEIGCIDDFVESFNELFEEAHAPLHYIESWDIAFFYES